MQIVKEKTAVEISAAVRGDDGSIVTPTTLKYRLDCLTTLQPIKAWTTLTPTAVTTIPITAAENAIRDDTNAYEDRSLVVLTDEGLATQQTTQHVYRVENLYGLV
jgi:hypothetical protein